MRSQFAGGIRSVDDIQQILRSGADKVSVNTSAVHGPTLITRGAEAFGTQCIVVAMDVRRNFIPNEKAIPVYLEDGRKCWYEVVIYGGSKPTGIDAVAWAREAEERGAGEILLTVWRLMVPKTVLILLLHPPFLMLPEYRL